MVECNFEGCHYELTGMQTKWCSKSHAYLARKETAVKREVDTYQEIAKNFIKDMSGDWSLMDVDEYLEEKGLPILTGDDLVYLADTINSAKIIVKFGR